MSSAALDAVQFAANVNATISSTEEYAQISTEVLERILPMLTDAFQEVKKFLLPVERRLLSAIGFTIALEGGLVSDIKKPSDNCDERFNIARGCIRIALRSRWDPPDTSLAGNRLAARLEHLSHSELVSLLSAAAIRDCVTREATEAALRPLSPVPWHMLPDVAIARIASVPDLNGVGGLAWCATCQTFRIAQPPLRQLCFGNGRTSRSPFRWPQRDDELSISIASTQAHRMIETIPPRFAAEITHLKIVAIHHSPDTPLRNHQDRPHGAQLTSLYALELEHPAAGYTGGVDDIDEDLAETLSSCASAIITNTATTLRELSIHARIRFTADDLIRLLPVVGPNLHHLDADLVPFTAFSRMGAGLPADTTRLQDAIQQHCPDISSSSVICHREPDVMDGENPFGVFAV